MDRIKEIRLVLGGPDGVQARWVDVHGEGVLTGLTCPIFQNKDQFPLLKRTCYQLGQSFHDASSIKYPLGIMGCDPDVAVHRFVTNSLVNRAGVTPYAP
jgi:hypothetical protein